MKEQGLVPRERITRVIRLLRGHKVMLDSDLALLYQVETRMLVQAVKRNASRFPADFMFQLTDEETEILRSQSVISKSWGGRRTKPYAFTEQGVAMLSSVLRESWTAVVGRAEPVLSWPKDARPARSRGQSGDWPLPF